MSWWIWVLIGLLLVAIEFTWATMHVGLFAVGAFVVALLVAFGAQLPLWGELLIFTGVSVAALVFVRPIIVRRLSLNERKVVESLVGEQAVALDEISVGGTGKADLRGATWTARNIGETALIRGQRCVVESIDGLVIRVRAS